MMQFDIRQLQVFLAVADNDGFSRAAKVLGMAQASVSERVAGLEKEIGAKLFDRLGRKVSLTKVGEILRERARDIVAARDKAAVDLRVLLKMKSGPVKMGGSTAPGEYRLPALIAEFKKQSPDITVLLSISDSASITDQVERGELEFGVVGRRESNDHLTFKKLWTDRIAVVVPPKHRWANKRNPIAPSELLKERWITREAGSATKGYSDISLRKAFGGRVPDLEVAAQLGSVSAVKAGIRAGLGIALLSSMTVQAELENGTLCTVDVSDLSIERTMYLVRDRRRSQSPAAGEVLKYIMHTSG